MFLRASLELQTHASAYGRIKMYTSTWTRDVHTHTHTHTHAHTHTPFCVAADEVDLLLKSQVDD